MLSNESRADVLIQALPYMQKYHGKIIVVNYGGDAMGNEELKQAVVKDLVLLNKVGVKIVLVHGGGAEIDDMLEKLQIESNFINGTRQTSQETMDVVQMVLAGKVNKNLVNAIETIGGKAVGLCGIDGHMIEAKMVNTDLGYVGDIVSVNTDILNFSLEKGYIPVISTIGYDKDGNVYNINADVVASRIAASLKATSLISMADVKGILKDQFDPDSLISVINVSDAPEIIKKGIVTGDMIPKVECCVDAVRRGVQRVFIIDGTVPHSILIEVLSDEGIGTMFSW